MSNTNIPSSEGMPVDGPGPRVLVVDDSSALRAAIAETLEEGGCSVVGRAMDGSMALRMVMDEDPDVITLDLEMPRMDGFEVLRRLRMDTATADLPVIMLTAKAQDADVFRGWQSGADCYLTKPFNPTELLVFVKRVLDPPPAEGGDRYQL